MANDNYVVWKEWRMWLIQNRDSQPEAPWLYLPFENSKGAFKRRLSLAELSGWCAKGRQSCHQMTMLVVVLSKSQLLPWPFVLCRTARSHGEKWQAAWEERESLCVSIKLPAAKSPVGSVALDFFIYLQVTFRTLENDAWHATVFLYFWSLESNGKILRELFCGRYFTSFSQFHFGRLFCMKSTE